MTEQVYGITVPGQLKFKLTFQEWIERWNACEDVQTAVGLLHGIYDANEGEEFDRDYKNHRLLFLLRLADEHADPGSNEAPVPVQIRSKAFNVLARVAFRPTNTDLMVQLPLDVQTALQTFFLNDNVRWEPALGPEASHSERVASDYMRRFCMAMWKSRRVPVESKIWAIELMHQFRQLHSLIPRYGDSWREFDGPVLEKLEQLALSEASSIEKAACNRSPAAMLLILARIAREEQRLAAA